MKILVIGGMHGNEPLGIEVARMFTENPIENVDTLLANEVAIEQNSRFAKVDLNRSFPGDLTRGDYEIKRAAEIVELCKRYDLVLDFHNTHCPDNDSVFIGDTATLLLRQVASHINLPRVIVADYDCLNKYAPNCISIEISLSSQRMNPKEWRAIITKLAKRTRLRDGGNCEFYRFAHRISLTEKDELNLERQKLKAFQPISPVVAKKIGVKSPAYPIFIGDAYTPYNYGGLLNKIKL